MDGSLGVPLMDIIDSVEFEVISVTDDVVWIGEIHSFLQHCHLGVDWDIELFVIARKGKNIIACAGLAGNTIKCVAVDIAWRGESSAYGLSKRWLSWQHSVATYTFSCIPVLKIRFSSADAVFSR